MNVLPYWLLYHLAKKYPFKLQFKWVFLFAHKTLQLLIYLGGEDEVVVGEAVDGVGGEVDSDLFEIR